MGTKGNAMNGLSVAGLKKWAKKNKGLAKTVCLAKAFAETERERVNAYAEKLFATYEFYNDLDGSGERLDTYHDLYLSEDEGGATKFYHELSALHVENGWTGDPEHCPALTAESLLTEAENALLASLGEFAGFDAGSLYSLELRNKALDLALTGCLGTLV
jgi:hypothetical protein